MAQVVDITLLLSILPEHEIQEVPDREPLLQLQEASQSKLPKARDSVSEQETA